MKAVKITVMKIACYQDLIDKYENPIEHTCDLKVGDAFISYDAKKPDRLCDSAWEIIYPFLKTLSEGGGDFYGGWMKNKYSCMLSCNDGFRPVSFLVEAIND